MEKENPVKSRWLTVLLLEPVSFSGIERDLNERGEIFPLYLENCTARWKTSCKETSCEAMM